MVSSVRRLVTAVRGGFPRLKPIDESPLSANRPPSAANAHSPLTEELCRWIGSCAGLRPRDWH